MNQQWVILDDKTPVVEAREKLSALENSGWKFRSLGEFGGSTVIAEFVKQESDYKPLR